MGHMYVTHDSDVYNQHVHSGHNNSVDNQRRITTTLSSLWSSLDSICLFSFFLGVPVITGDSVVKVAHLLWLSAIFLGNLVVKNLPKVTEVISTCSL